MFNEYKFESKGCTCKQDRECEICGGIICGKCGHCNNPECENSYEANIKNREA